MKIVERNKMHTKSTISFSITSISIKISVWWAGTMEDIPHNRQHLKVHLIQNWIRGEVPGPDTAIHGSAKSILEIGKYSTIGCSR